MAYPPCVLANGAGSRTALTRRARGLPAPRLAGGQVKPLLPEETVRKIVFVTSTAATLDAVFADEFDEPMAAALRAQIAEDKLS